MKLKILILMIALVSPGYSQIPEPPGQKAKIVGDQNTTVADVSLQGSLKASTARRVLGGSFGLSSLDLDFWSDGSSGPGFITVLNILTLTSGGAAGLAEVNSLNDALFIPGQTTEFQARVSLANAGSVGQRRRWGVFDSLNGSFFEDNAGTFSVCTRKAGVDTCVVESSWNVQDISPYNSIVTYKISYTPGSVVYEMNGQVVHQHVTNVANPTWTDDFILPIRFEAETISGAASSSYTVTAAHAHIFGELSTVRINNIPSEIKSETPLNVTGAVQVGETPNGIFKQQRKGGVVDSLSTVIPLGSSGSFIPGFIETESYEGISILLSGSPSTATGTLILDFSRDGISPDRTVSIPVTDLTTANPRTVTVIASYFRIRYVNDAIAQTSFSIQVIFHNTKSDLTSRLDQSIQGDEDVTNSRSAIVARGPDGIFRNVKATNSGDLGIAIFDPETGVPALVTPAGALKISEIVHLAGDAFGNGPLALNKWEITTTNGGTQSETNGELILATNGGVDANVQINTFTRARFYPGHFNTAHVAAQLSSVWSTPNTIAEWGAFDANDPINGDGIFIRFTAGEFNIVTRRQGVENVVNEADFSNFIPTKSNLTTVYEIGFNAGTARFFQGTRVFHIESARAGPYVGTPHLKVGARLYNINGSSEVHDLRFRAIGMYRVGRPFAVPDFIFVDTIGVTTIKTNPGTLHRIIMSRAGGGASTDTITFHDGPDATFPVIAVIAMSANDNKSHTFSHTFNNGLSVDLSSSQFSLTVVFD